MTYLLTSSAWGLGFNTWGRRVAWSEELATLDLGVMSLSPSMVIEIILKK